MVNFKYCIWLAVNDNHIWNKITNGFIPHITIKSDLELDEAVKLYNSIEKKKYEVILDKIESTSYYNFNAIQYSIYMEGEKIPVLYNDDSHISFNYRYDKKYTQNEIELFDKKNKIRNGLFNKYILVRCDGDFKTWKNNIMYIDNVN